MCLCLRARVCVYTGWQNAEQTDPGMAGVLGRRQLSLADPLGAPQNSHSDSLHAFYSRAAQSDTHT